MTSIQIQLVCKFNAGAATCRYLRYGAEGYVCLKVIPTMKAAIDRRVELKELKAIGDNCEGDGRSIHLV